MAAPVSVVNGNGNGNVTFNNYNAAPAAATAESSSVAPAVPVAAAAAPKRKRAQGTGCVRQVPSTGKWIGQCNDVSERQGKKAKKLSTKCFDTAEEAEAALATLVASTDAKKAAKLHEKAQQLDHTRGLPLRPVNPADAEPRTAYYGAKLYKKRGAEVKEFVPERYARGSAGKGKFQMFACCRDGIGALKACTKQVGKGDRPYCDEHGGGLKVGEASSKRCSLCRSVYITLKRRRSQGGNGLCPSCDARVEAEKAAEAAAKAGQPPPPPSAKKRVRTKEHELKMLERLVLAGYVESTTKGVAPRPGEFTREVYFDHRCALAREFAHGEKQYAYVDFVVHPKRGGKLVFLEIDENEHKFDNYSVLCDTTRMWNVCESVKLDFSGDKNVLWLRVNPNTKFAIGDTVAAVVHSRLSNTARCDAVCALLDTLEGRPDDPSMTVAYAFYQLKADGATPQRVDDPDYHPDVRRGVLPLAHKVSADGRSVRLGADADEW